MDQPNASRRSVLRFSVGFLLLAVSVVAVALAAVTRQLRAVRRVEALGGEVLFDYEYRIYSPRGGPRQFPSNWEKAAFSTVTGVNFDGKSLRDSDLLTFARIVRTDLPKVERLSIRNTRVTDIQPLAQMEQLKWLDISGTPVKDVLPLNALRKLDVLYMEDVQASPAAVSELNDLLEQCVIYHQGNDTP